VSATETLIQTRIAQIVSPTQVVLAAGSDDGVEEGMEFVIYELSDPIEDPETKESLGQLELPKGRLKVVHVQDRISSARTMSRKVERQRDIMGLDRYFGTWNWTETVYEQLPLDDSVAKKLPEPSRLTVKIGDLARNVPSRH
jgi:hypothetical protein